MFDAAIERYILIARMFNKIRWKKINDSKDLG